MTLIYKTVLITLLFPIVLTAGDSQKMWKDISISKASESGESLIKTTEARTLQLKTEELTNLLLSAPIEFSLQALQQPLIIELPIPDGSFQSFAIVESPVCHPELSAKYPETNTWSGQGITNKTATVRLDVTPWGFHAMILSPHGDIFIDPYNKSTRDIYLCYYKKNTLNIHGDLSCGLDNSGQRSQLPVFPGVQRSAGDLLRVYDLALACTGEYAAFHGGTKPLVHAEMVTSINRVSGVYEKEMAVRLQLVANNDTLIFLNAATDPYSNNNPSSLLTQNQTTVTSLIGTLNYDIGHVYSTGGGGLASLGVVCANGSKAQGETGLASPVGDAFYIDYVAHEMGHQFGGNHTFNGTSGSCSGNANATTAFEPGSGSTIMAYAFICPGQNLQNFSDAYFHTASFDEIQDLTSLGAAACAVNIVTNNNPPIINSIGVDQNIPFQTPFILTGSAYDPDGDSITYCWEQYDTGPLGSPNSPSGNAPIFRSILPTIDSTRTFPKLTSIINNINVIGERLPTYARNLQFRLTVRDNKNNGGGVTYEDVLLTLNVVNTTTPFAVTQPNTNVNWPGLSSQTITWNVSSTDQAPINCSLVNILLSVDGGFTYPYTLAAAVANIGSATVTLPNITSTTARVKVESAGNIFFDISNTNFTISTPQNLSDWLESESIIISPNPAHDIAVITMSGKIRGAVQLTVYDVSGRSLLEQLYIKKTEGLVENINLSNFAKGTYFIQLKTENGASNKSLVKL